MKQLINDMKWFLSHRIYVIALVLTAVCGYGFSIVQPSIGIDDTATVMYFVDGLAVVMGRWTIFLLNKIFNMAEYRPFMMEVIGIILFCLAVTLFCVLIKRIVGDRIGIVGYTIFACIFISNPIISEVNIYYIHNGSDLAFLLTAAALLAFLEAMDCKGKRRITNWIYSMLLILVAAGCYESMMLVYIMGLLLILFLRGMVDRDKLTFSHIAGNLCAGALILIVAVVLRSIILKTIIGAFHLEAMIGVENLRTVAEFLQLFEPGNGMATFTMLLKRYWLVYFVNAIVYLPVAGYVLATVIVGAASVIVSIKKRNGWYLVLYMGMMITPMLLTFVEVMVTKYRSCQALVVFTALGWLFLYMGACRLRKVKWISYVCVAFAVIMVYNQATELNQGFYVDYKKYEHTKDVLTEIAWEIERDYGNDVPVIFTGHYDTPYPLLKDYVVGYGSKEFQRIALITDLVDPHLKEKYFTPWGYSFVGEANYPFIQWGMMAFDDTCTQIINFLNIHGHSFTTITDQAVLEEAAAIAETLPNWPAEGSISMQNGYVLVHI